MSNIRRSDVADSWPDLPAGARGIAQALEVRAINAETEAARLRQQLEGAVKPSDLESVLRRIADGRYTDANGRVRRFTARDLRDMAAEAIGEQ